MDGAIVVLCLILGIGLGAGVGWFLAKATMGRSFAEEQMTAKAQAASLTERLGNREEEIMQLSQRLEVVEAELESHRSELLEISTAKAAAEEKARSIPELKQSREVLEAQKESLASELSRSMNRVTELETIVEEERKRTSEKISMLIDAGEQLQNTFKALSAQALNENSQAFLTLAKSTLERFQAEAQGDLSQRQQAVESLITPLRESLSRYDQQIQAIENSRKEAYGNLSQQVQSLLTSQLKLQSETGNLVKALHVPQVRGRWGELTLRRVVELAGMVPYCDFEEQQSVSTDAGRLRPDMTVRLPGGKNIVVDAKASIQGYLDALDASDEEARRVCLQAHARQIRSRLQELSGKAYWDRLEATPEFVILFIPGDSFYAAALEQDPQLVEDGVEQKVILATPLTLIALLRAVAFGWRQERIAENAREISDLGKELYERLSTMTDHLRNLGRNLGNGLDAYNKFVGSLESRVLASARKFKELGATAQEDILELSPIDQSVREVQSPELLQLPEGNQKSSKTKSV
ncbi:MAG: DNA recombination protein RmuC [Terriglobia bacterium]